MGENIVVNVEFHGTNLGTVNEIQVVPSDIAWEDLDLMLKVYAGHDEEEQLIVKYRDDDNDEITISTQEELNEAFKVAKRSNNTLQLRVICDLRPDPGTQEGNVVVRANVMNQSVSMATTAPADITSTDGAAATEVKTVDVPDVVLSVNHTDKEMDEVASLPNIPDVELVAMDTEAGKDEAAATNDDCVIMEVTTPKTVKDDAKITPTLPTPPTVRRLFYIVNKATGHVMDINGGNPRPGTAVIMWPRKPGAGPGNNNQLWYWDEKTMTIRSALNNLCLDVSGCRGIMAEYKPDMDTQQWALSENQIQHRFNPNWVMVASASKPGAWIVATDASVAGQNKWQIEYLEPVTKKVCMTNKETGEQCPSANKGCRPKASKRSSTDSHREGNKSKGRSSGSPRKGKKDHYAMLAKEVGKEMRSSPPVVVPSSAKKQSSAATNTASIEETPPQWFFSYMDKFKKEVTDDMSKMIVRRTVHEVLKGLNNAVIDTIKVNEQGDIRSVRPEPMEGNVMYRHHNAICDKCDRTIVGVRYKCGNCEDYDLCEDCEKSGNAHNPDHIFLKIRRPMESAGRKKNGKMVPMLKKRFSSGEDTSGGSESDEKLRRKEEKILHKYGKLEEKMMRTEKKIRQKEEKLKRHLEVGKETPLKKEKLDLPEFKVVGLIDLEFIRDESIPDGTRVQPGTRFIKKWLVRNIGGEAWDSAYRLVMMWGNMTPVAAEVPVLHLAPMEQGILTVDLVAPNEPGVYQSHWRLSHEGQRYGHRLWCSIIVEPKEILEPLDRDTSMLDVPAEKQQEEEEEFVLASAPLVTMETKAASEPPTPAPRENEDAPGDLQHISSFETLTIGERSRAKASQTATPNNTPRNVTPPKSPIPELRGLSNSSSVEVVALDAEDEDEDTMSRMTELVQERMATLGLKPDRDLDLDSWSSCEDNDDSDDTDSDFYVVPIPDCFNPELPPTSSASTSIYIKKDEARSIDELLMNSQSLESQPLLQPSIGPSSGEVEAVSAAGPSEDAPKEMTSEVIVVDVDEPRPNQADYEPLPGSNDDGTGDGQDGADDGQDNDDVIVVRVELPNGQVFEGNETLPKEVEVTMQAAAHANDTQAMEGAVGGQDDEVTDQNANLPLDINDNSAGTPNQEPTEASAPPMDDPREMSPMAGELASQVLTAAREMASYASRTVNTAYSTATDVYRTLQARDRYTPPASNWEPKQEPWTPPPCTWTPPQTHWSPSPEPAPISSREQTAMEQLIDMGFANREQNRHLLEKYNNDMEKVIAELVQNDDSDWSSSRH